MGVEEVFQVLPFPELRRRRSLLLDDIGGVNKDVRHKTQGVFPRQSLGEIHLRHLVEVSFLHRPHQSARGACEIRVVADRPERDGDVRLVLVQHRHSPVHHVHAEQGLHVGLIVPGDNGFDPERMSHGVGLFACDLFLESFLGFETAVETALRGPRFRVCYPVGHSRITHGHHIHLVAGFGMVCQKPANGKRDINHVGRQHHDRHAHL